MTPERAAEVRAWLDAEQHERELAFLKLGLLIGRSLGTVRELTLSRAELAALSTGYKVTVDVQEDGTSTFRWEQRP